MPPTSPGVLLDRNDGRGVRAGLSEDFRTGSKEMIRRYAHNPILTKADIPYPVETVHNAAVVKHGNEYIMLFRSHLRTGRSIIGLARSADRVLFTAHAAPLVTA